jgi:hypothetical protein
MKQRLFKGVYTKVEKFIKARVNMHHREETPPSGLQIRFCWLCSPMTWIILFEPLKAPILVDPVVLCVQQFEGGSCEGDYNMLCGVFQNEICFPSMVGRLG